MTTSATTQYLTESLLKRIGDIDRFNVYQEIDELLEQVRKRDDLSDKERALYLMQLTQGRTQFVDLLLDSDLIIEEPNNLCTLTEKGLLLKRIGIEKYEERKEGQLHKPWYDHENARHQFEDYPRLKRNSIISFWISIISILISATLLYLKWKE